jgi:hypothetical protein
MANWRYLQLDITTRDQALISPSFAAGLPPIHSRSGNFGGRSRIVGHLVDRLAHRRLDAHDTYMDTPYWEQPSTSGTLASRLFFLRYCWRRDSLARRSQRLTIRIPDGITLSRYPTSLFRRFLLFTHVGRHAQVLLCITTMPSSCASLPGTRATLDWFLTHKTPTVCLRSCHGGPSSIGQTVFPLGFHPKRRQVIPHQSLCSSSPRSGMVHSWKLRTAIRLVRSSTQKLLCARRMRSEDCAGTKL